ncbi:DNA mismatch repair protein MutT [Bifidobacterium gallicum DSM 20093 = LMG 11596]|nr:DNA mismatch repair protein MutT [Bifidobacterium gallicum DSM 20093 = LMG 11596]
MKLIDVAGAAIVRDGRVLCAQRRSGKSLAGFWEFPGGKIEQGETPDQALRREIAEELRCGVQVGERVCTSEYDYDFGHVHLTVFLCHLLSGDPVLTEHAQMRWVLPVDMPALDWAPVDADPVRLISAMTF